MKNNILSAKQWVLLVVLNMSISAFAQKAPLGNWEILKLNHKDSVLLTHIWGEIVNSIQTRNYEQLKGFSLKNIYGESLGHIWPGFSKEQSIPIDSFINVALIKHYDQHFINIISDSSYHINVTKYKNRKFPNIRSTAEQKITLYEIYFIDYVPIGNEIKDENYYEFKFIKMDGKFKLFGIDLAWPGSIKR